jgi:shikimate dehydrogenase
LVWNDWLERKSEMHVYGLIGKSLEHSFSPNFFAEKFRNEGIRNTIYLPFERKKLDGIRSEMMSLKGLKGLNVTIPFKQSIMDYLDECDDLALQIGAVNTIKILANGNWIGFNTDTFGFVESLRPLLKNDSMNALILGTGGASKAVAFGLKQLGIPFRFVSRKNGQDLSYSELTSELISSFQLIINTTPRGMWPMVESKPDLPYETISTQHLLYDLVYNPKETAFLKEGLKRQAAVKNGLEMLHIQAEESWGIWQKSQHI